MTDDRKIIADVLEHDRLATEASRGTLLAYGPVGGYNATASWAGIFPEEGSTLLQPREDIAMAAYLQDAQAFALCRTAAPELARRLAALLDIIEEQTEEWRMRDPLVYRAHLDIAAAYARNLAEGSKP